MAWHVLPSCLFMLQTQSPAAALCCSCALQSLAARSAIRYASEQNSDKQDCMHVSISAIGLTILRLERAAEKQACLRMHLGSSCSAPVTLHSAAWAMQLLRVKGLHTWHVEIVTCFCNIHAHHQSPGRLVAAVAAESADRNVHLLHIDAWYQLPAEVSTELAQVSFGQVTLVRWSGVYTPCSRPRLVHLHAAGAGGLSGICRGCGRHLYGTAEQSAWLGGAMAVFPLDIAGHW